MVNGCWFSLQIPALGKHYSQRWAQEDLLEEQREGARANDKKKSMIGPLSELDAKGNGNLDFSCNIVICCCVLP